MPNYLYQKYAEELYPEWEDEREEYLAAVAECKARPAYHITLPTGTLQPCICEPLLNDKTNLLHKLYPDGNLGSWKKVRSGRGSKHN